ncbi:ketopantoate hydroxymethyltransferase [Gorgonomyces haynaldii]|nr:ketopantoate hydroxymethyltransferase [Gorgonomyces haynaldii]
MTAHDYASGYFVEQAGIDMCLVGDSLAMVALGDNSTNHITLDQMIHHARAVQKGAKNTFIIGDMPFGTYEVSSTVAVQNAIRYVQEGNVEAVKLEGGLEMAPTIKHITQVGIPVLGHIGLTPQRANALGGFKVQGKTANGAKKLLDDALALQEAGCFSIVLEAVPQSVATFITQRIGIPTIGIGAGNGTSGQVLVQMDILGAYPNLAPKFSKIYANVGQISIDALKQYNNEVKSREFPVSGTHTYKMSEGEEEKLKDLAADLDTRDKASV